MTSCKILLFIDGLDSGGAQRQLIGLAGLLHKKGYDVKIIAYKKGAVFYEEELKSTGIPFENIQSGPLKGFFFLKKEIFRWRPYCVISFLNQNSMLACLLKLMKDYKLIVSERNTNTQISWKDRLRFFLYEWSDAIVSNSHSQYNFINKHYPQFKEKSTVITNFVDTQKFSPIAKQNSQQRIIAVARIAPQKNIKGLIKAIAIAAQQAKNMLPIHWYGEEWDKQYYKECVELIKELNISEYFIFKGESSTILNEYRNATALCLPSYKEGTPNVIAEAMACGLPVLCSDVCDNPRYVKENENGFLFNPNNPIEIANSLLQFLRLKPEDKEKMGRKSRQMAETSFSTDCFAQKYIDLIESL